MTRRSPSPSSLPAAERQLRSRLRQLLSQADGFLHGSLVVMTRRCGRPSCRCATDEDARHQSLYLGQTLKGKTTMIYIPARLEATVRQWHENSRQAETLIEALSQQGRLRLARDKGAAKPKPKTPRASRKATPPKPPRKPS